MKDKNLPDDNNSKSLEELTQEVNSIIEELEKQKDIKNSLDDYQKLIKLNNIIEKKFQRKSKSISQNMKEKIENITKKKNVKRSK
jgi:ribosomal protein L15